jgi:hypothetical protein
VEVTMSISMDADRIRALRWLEDAGAREIVHLNGTLLDHLQGTEQLLRNWGAAEALALAGLCHAVYGTDGFAPRLLELSDRSILTGLIGEDAESIVYFYASCDRSFLYGQVGAPGVPVFRVRFTAAEFVPSETQLRSFAELTFANELEILSTAATSAPGDRAALARLFSRMRDLASERAYRAAIDILGYVGNLGAPPAVDGNR